MRGLCDYEGTPSAGLGLAVLATRKLSAYLAFAVLVGTAPSTAGESETAKDVYRLPCTAPDMQKEPMRKRLIDPAHPVAINLGPHKFQIPWKYMHPRPFSTHLNCDPSRKWIGIQYWIPDFEAADRDLFWQPEFRPTEKKRPKLESHESIVKARAVPALAESCGIERSR